MPERDEELYDTTKGIGLNAGADEVAPEPGEVHVDPSVLAVDSIPDQVRTGSQFQDETTGVQQGEELRRVDDSTE